MYSAKVSFVLIAMVLTGAVRGVGVKIIYQRGLDKAIFITILFQIGGLPAFPVYLICTTCSRWVNRKVGPGHKATAGCGQKDTTITGHSGRILPIGDRGAAIFEQVMLSSPWWVVERWTFLSALGFPHLLRRGDQMAGRSPSNGDGLHAHTHSDVEKGKDNTDHPSTVAWQMDQEQQQGVVNCLSPSQQTEDGCVQPNSQGSRDQLNYRSLGSQTGLNDESHAAAKLWIKRIPRYGHWLVLGILSFTTYLLRWGSFLYLKASTAEMLLNGFELLLVAAAARVIRKRTISWARWKGISLVVVGLVTIAVSDQMGQNQRGGSDEKDNEEAPSSASERFTGIVLCLVHGVLAVFLAMQEELLTQEGNYPALICMGHEGLFGTIFGLALYFPLAPLFSDNPMETWKQFTSSTADIVYVIVLLQVFTIAGMANIFSVSTTSSMTRDIWQHLRAIPVWVIGLLVYYCIDESSKDQEDLGEPWMMPHSLFILLGFIIMMSGVALYYHEPIPAQ